MADTVRMVQRPAHASAALDLRRHYGASYLIIHTPHAFIHTYIQYIYTYT